MGTLYRHRCVPQGWQARGIQDSAHPCDALTVLEDSEKAHDLLDQLAVSIDVRLLLGKILGHRVHPLQSRLNRLGRLLVLSSHTRVRQHIKNQCQQLILTHFSIGETRALLSGHTEEHDCRELETAPDHERILPPALPR